MLTATGQTANRLLTALTRAEAEIKRVRLIEQLSGGKA